QMRYELVRANGTQKLRIYWTPHPMYVGVHPVKLHVADRLNQSATVSFDIAVIDDNQPPVIEYSGNARAEATIPFHYQIDAWDPDGDALTYSLAVAPHGMTVDADTGLISWVPDAHYDNDQEWFRFVVTDARGLTTEKSESVYVARFHNRAPEFTPTWHPETAKVGVEYRHQVQATDREGDLPITYKLYTIAPGATIDAQTGTVAWTPPREG